MTHPTLAVVIPTVGRPGALRACLDALGAQTDLGFEVVVVCDGPDEGTERLASGYTAPWPIAWVFLDENKGPSQARNVGVRHARSDVVLFFDDDMLPSPGCIGAHKQFHASHVAGRWVAMGNTTETFANAPGSYVESELRRERFPFAADAARLMDEMARLADAVTVFCGNNCSIRCADYLASGGSDQALRSGEDLELGARLSLAGVRFAVLPQAAAEHRNVKNLQAHFAASWKGAYRGDIHRLRERGQRLPHLRGLAAACEGSSRQRGRLLLSRAAPETARRLAEMALAAANGARSPNLFRLWKGLASAAAQADAMHEEGVGMSELRALIGHPVCVLGLHSISAITSASDAQHGMSPSSFASLVDRLCGRGMRFVTPDALLRPTPARAVCLTFDDGYEDFIHNAAPVLLERKVPATVFVVAGRIGQRNDWDARAGLRPRRLLDASQLRELHRAGFNIGCHSMTHADLTKLGSDRLREEVFAAKRKLEDVLGAPVDSFAYPYGFVDPAARAAVAEAGYRTGFGVEAGLNFCDDPFVLKRVGISERDSAIDLALKLRNGRSWWQQSRGTLRTRAHSMARLFAG